LITAWRLSGHARVVVVGAHDDQTVRDTEIDLGHGLLGASPNPQLMSELLHKCMTKATTAEGDQRKYGPNWVISRRGSLKIFDDRLECGDWRIDYTEIKDAVLCSFRSFFLRIPGYILTVETNDRTYHFGLNGWASASFVL
jgi:hypothetical protein